MVFFIAGSVGQIVVSMTGGMYIVRVFALSSYFSYVIALIILSISIGFNLYGLKMSGVFQVCIGVLTFFILLITIISSLPYIEIKNINVHISMHEINPILEASLLIFGLFWLGSYCKFSFLNLNHLEKEILFYLRDLRLLLLEFIYRYCIISNWNEILLYQC